MLDTLNLVIDQRTFGVLTGTLVGIGLDAGAAQLWAMAGPVLS